MNVHVMIERLVLDGIDMPHHQRPILLAAVEGELAHLLASGGVSADLLASGAVDRVSGGSIHLAEGKEPTYLGQQIARAVHGGIGE